MKAFQANLAKLEGADTQVLGVSVDSPFANHAFAMQNGITFPLLGDMNAKAIRDYGLEKDYDARTADLVILLQSVISDRFRIHVPEQRERDAVLHGKRVIGEGAVEVR